MKEFLLFLFCRFSFISWKLVQCSIYYRYFLFIKCKQFCADSVIALQCEISELLTYFINYIYISIKRLMVNSILHPIWIKSNSISVKLWPKGVFTINSKGISIKKIDDRLIWRSMATEGTLDRIKGVTLDTLQSYLSTSSVEFEICSPLLC